MAMAAAEPAPAAVITCARGSARLPATHTPATLVRPGGVGGDPALVVDVAAEPDDELVVRNEAGRHEQRVAGHDAAVATSVRRAAGRRR